VIMLILGGTTYFTMSVIYKCKIFIKQATGRFLLAQTLLNEK
jgi:hypothetical protein